MKQARRAASAAFGTATAGRFWRTMGFVGALLASTATVNAADDIVIDQPDYSGFFGSLSGAYVLEDPNRPWQFIGFVPQNYSRAGVGQGFRGDAELGYRFGAWDVSLGLTYADLARGDASMSTTPNLNVAWLSASLVSVDLLAGYNTSFGATTVRAAGGLRYAAWNNTVDTFWAGAPIPVNGPIHHNFRGLGPMVKFDASTPVGSGTGSIDYGASASVLFGRLRTYSNNPAYVCTGCSTRGSTGYSLGGHVGYAFDVTPSARAVVGWQAEYWGNVNVAVTDTTFLGDDSGKSGHLVTGPFVKIKF